MPIEAFWDQADSRLLAIETEYALTDDLSLGAGEVAKSLNERTVEEINEDFSNQKKEETFTGKTIETYFVTTDYGIKR